MKNKVDFMPEDYLEKKAQRRTNIVCLFLFLVVVAGVGGGFLYTEREQSSLKEKVAKVNGEMLQANEALKQLDTLEEKKTEMATKAAISAMLMEPVPRSLLLATITNCLPARVSLIEYALVSKEVINNTPQVRSRNKKARTQNTEKKSEADAFVPPQMETKIELTGIAPTDLEVAKLISNLNESSLFAQVNLQMSEEYEYADETVRRYKLMLILNPQARASNKDVEMARRQHVQGM